jgi:ABC-2 type transport system ATP-binding protein
VQIVEMRELLRSLKGEHTIVLSSHILSEISETCDRIFVIKDGTIAASGTESELTSRLRSGFRVKITIAGGAPTGYRDSSRVREVAAAVTGVKEVREVPPEEPGEGVSTLEVQAEHDVRIELCRALVEKGVGILQIGPGERELESVFLELATPAEAERSTPRKAKRKKAAAAAPKKDEEGSHE